MPRLAHLRPTARGRGRAPRRLRARRCACRTGPTDSRTRRPPTPITSQLRSPIPPMLDRLHPSAVLDGLHEHAEREQRADRERDDREGGGQDDPAVERRRAGGHRGATRAQRLRRARMASTARRSSSVSTPTVGSAVSSTRIAMPSSSSAQLLEALRALEGRRRQRDGTRRGPRGDKRRGRCASQYETPPLVAVERDRGASRSRARQPCVSRHDLVQAVGLGELPRAWRGSSASSPAPRAAVQEGGDQDVSMCSTRRAARRPGC